MFQKKIFYPLLMLAIIGVVVFIFFMQATDDEPTSNEEIKTIVDSSDSVDQQVENLAAFTRLYGYIRYFHPSDEAEQIDWERFAMYGTGYVSEAKNTEELKSKLVDLFFPIAPTIQIYLEGEEVKDPFENINKHDPGLKYVAWQHLGKESSLRWNVGLYQKKRVIFNETSSSEKLFETLPKMGETISESINKTLKVNLPIVLYIDGEKTLGTTDESLKKLNDLLEQIKSVQEDSEAANLQTRLAGVTILWNDIQHFYPYFEEVDVDWLQELPSFIQNGLNTKDKEEYEDVIRYMTEKLGDGHIGMNDTSWMKGYRTPFTVDFADKQLVITSTIDETYQVGDIILSINGTPAMEYLAELGQVYSGSPQVKSYMSLQAFEYKQKDEALFLEIERNGESLSLEVEYFYEDVYEKYGLSNFPVIQENFIEIEPEIFYVNALELGYYDIHPYLDSLKGAKGIIFEFRGYPKKNVIQILSHLSDEVVESPQWLREQIVYPDHKKLVGYDMSRWEIEPQSPKFKGTIVFITNAQAISAPETLLGVVEDNNLGLIVGQPTAGANGNVTEIDLPGHRRIIFTGMKVLKGNGMQHHLIGVKPTHEVERTISGVKAGIDEYIEKALELIKKVD